MINDKDRIRNAIAAELKNMEMELQRYKASEEEIWKQTEIPCSLSGAVRALKKEEMTLIRQTLNLKKLSALKKDALAAELVRLIPKTTEKTLSLFDSERLDLVTEIIENGGTVPYKAMEFDKLQWFRDYGVVFPVLHERDMLLAIPCELVDIIKRSDPAKLGRTAVRNTEWIRLTYGMLYYYGVMDLSLIIKNIERLTGQEIDIRQFIEVIYASVYYYNNIYYSTFGYCSMKVIQCRDLVIKRDELSDISYYEFTYEQLFEAGDPDFKYRTPAIREFIGFLLGNYEPDNDKIDEIADDISRMVNMGSNVPEIVGYIKKHFELSTGKFEAQMISRLSRLAGNLPRWVLKGHTQNELSGKKDTPVDYSVIKKAGRNDPCPCGSGLKYKKCCGR